MSTEQTSEIQSVVVQPGGLHPTEDRPLISFCLVAYNQEQFIREAVEGAFSQTYSPLEIILSDDYSSDRTFEIMWEMAAAYSGPHKIITNKNEKNLGIGGHINRVVQISSGELIVGAGGDDISLPERTSEIYQAWIGSGKKAFSIDSAYMLINECGNNLDFLPIKDLPKEQQLLHFSKTLVNYVHGCTHAWHKKVFDVFGLLPDIAMEDLVIPPRSMLLGSVVRINKPLVKYRTHDSNIFKTSKKFTIKEGLDREIFALKDRINGAIDVVRCISEYKRTETDPSRLCYFDTCILNMQVSIGKFALRLHILTDSPVIRLYALAKYIFLYGFQRYDVFLVVCAVSKKAFMLISYSRRLLRACHILPCKGS